MSSGFVPAGADAASSKPDDAWVKAQQLVAQSRSAESKPIKQDDGKSLYDVLQQNKAAKQEAFEEAARLKNQFRSLGDDEIEFLDSVLESTRAKEAEVRKDTAEQLEIFRKQREAAEKVQFEEENANTSTAGSPSTQETWAARSKKRRRGNGTDPSLGAKLRKMSSTEPEKSEKAAGKEAVTVTNSNSLSAATASNDRPDIVLIDQPGAPMVKQTATPATTLGLADYNSDDD